jgi:LysR family nitrogen assimilation transcriptional regulator
LAYDGAAPAQQRKADTVDTRKLEYFVKIVDSGSITKAAAALHVAQPALSQQVSALEKELKQRLLIRSKQGVEPTAAGHALYRHAQTILRLVEEARQDVATSGAAPSGRVSIAIAPYSMASSLAPRIVAEVRRRYPDIMLHLTEIVGGVLSEAIKNGKLDMALIYEPGEIRGVRFTTMIVEDLYVVTSPDVELAVDANGAVPLREAAKLDFFLPESNHTIRQLVDRALAEQGLPLRLAGEIESVPSLSRLLHANLGATILPRSAADALFPEHGYKAFRIVEPALQCKIALCTADHEPMSEAASAVLILLRDLVKSQLLAHYGTDAA